MHSNGRGFAVAFVAVVLVVLAMRESPGAPNAPAVSASPLSENSDAARLLLKIKAIIDKGLLYEPQEMARTLQLQMRFKEEPANIARQTCPDGSAGTQTMMTTAEIDNTWFKPGPEGIQHMKFPQAFINPAGEVGAPTVSYETFKSRRCGDKDYDRVEAQLSFNNLSGFSCLTPDRLKTLINANYSMATDGVSVSSYAAPANDRYGSSVDFIFRMGAPCALGATIRQNTRDGQRERRAFSNWRWCSVRADHDFCATHAALKPEESDLLRRNSEAVCGTEESFLAKEPLSDLPPKDLPVVEYRPYGDPPCLGK